MEINVNGTIYDTLYKAMVDITLTVPISNIWSNADEIDFYEANFRGVYTTTITFSETDIVNYEWVYANRCDIKEKVLFLKPSKFPDARIFKYLENIKYGINEDIPIISWSYEEFDEYNYPLKNYIPSTIKHEFHEEQPPNISITLNDNTLPGNENNKNYILLDKKILEETSKINWDDIVEDKFMGKIKRHCITNQGEKYKEIYTIKEVRGTTIKCEEYNIPKIHYDDEIICHEPYRNRNVTLNKIIDWIQYEPYSIKEEL